MRTFGSLKVGFIGLCLTAGTITPDKLTRIRLIDPLEAAATYLPLLQNERVDIIVALTHLTFDEDRRLAERFPEIDVIVGGHEHFPITATENRTLISKAGSDAKFVARIDLNRRGSGTVERFFELIPITSAITDDPRTAAVVNSYMSRMGAELDVVVATSRVTLEGRAVRLRASETNLGNLVADAMRADADADIAILNSGSIRGDRVHRAGGLTRRTLLEIHPFGNVVCKVAVSGRIVLEALDSGVSKLPVTAGQFPQVSGLTMHVDPTAPAGKRVRDVRVQGASLDPARTYTLALPDFILRGGDEYSMFGGQRVLISPESGNLLVTAIEKYVKAAREVAPSVDGRITIGR